MALTNNGSLVVAANGRTQYTMFWSFIVSLVEQNGS